MRSNSAPMSRACSSRLAGGWASPQMAGRPAAKNARLLEADGFPRIAEELLMVEIDAGHHGAIRIPGIDRVEAAAHAHFQHDHIRIGALKQPHGRQGALFEIGQGDLAPGRLHRREGLAQLGVGCLVPARRTRSL
jgi:hypothetical protein